jgi:glycosyltransferase involved in cell wall biosynthesis
VSSLRIALLCPRTRPETDAHAPELLDDLGSGLSARGHGVRMITSHPGRPSTTVRDGLELRRNWRPPAGRLDRRGFESQLTHVPASLLSLARGSDEIAHASRAPDAAAAAAWSRPSGRPALFSCMELADREWLVQRRLRVECMLRAVRGCAAVVAPSRFAAQAMESSLGVRARVIHPGVDLERFTGAGERSPSPSILCATPIDASGDWVDALVAALAHVRRTQPDATLVLPAPRDAALASALGGQAGIELIHDDPRTLPGDYRRAWVSVHCGARDAFPRVLAESLASGTPVVASDLGAGREIVDGPRIGVLVSREDPLELARALLAALELASDPGTAAACRARAQQMSLDRCVDAYEAVYRELLAKV